MRLENSLNAVVRIVFASVISFYRADLTGRALAILDFSVLQQKIKAMAGKGKGKADNETGPQHHGYAPSQLS
jgi:hypothetical protein